MVDKVIIVSLGFSIESYQVADSVEEACDLEGRPSANHFELEKEKWKSGEEQELQFSAKILGMSIRISGMSIRISGMSISI